MFKKSISGILLISVVSLSGGAALLIPKPAKAITTSDIWQAINTAWEFVADNWTKIQGKASLGYQAISAAYNQWEKSKSILAQAARVAAQLLMHQVLNMLTNQIIEWIQGGGEPQFISDWEGFLTDAFDKAGGIFVERYLGAGYLCESFDSDIKLALLDTPTFETRASCTLSDMEENIQSVVNDFRLGTWTDWISITKPENNFYGAYLIAREEKIKEADKAREAAIREAEAGSGFMAIKECIKGYDMSNPDIICHSAESCEAQEDLIGPSFKCTKKRTITPGSVVSDLTSEIVNQPLKIIQNQIGDMADSMGILGPYITAIGNALTNRVIREGLAYVQSIGPSPSNPNAPLPGGSDIPSIDESPAQATQDQGFGAALADQQELLKENISNQLLPQQQSNLSVLQNIESIQTNIIDLAATFGSCAVPSWVSQISLDRAQTRVDIADMQSHIRSTNQWVTDIQTAINSTNGYIATIDDYLDYYEQTLQPPTDEEQLIIDEKRALMDTAKNLAISNGQTAANASSTSIVDLEIDTQDESMNVVQVTSNLLMARGLSAEYPQDGTLYGQQRNFQNRLSNLQTRLDTCDMH